ncbi:hypothetical protein P170DRAFT_24711 [Aspergillus steynii IBT 23096]|uniref:GPI anchored protein n=1 Tax=Aspergillus steynii IBT 23096 TaxID=1392250 RepID=A0A2I2GPH4_9EURO|nr:uncharacterized protein P170DRAFT_24711 [Aspergillus steynii IBT 23096]PLB54781.1 hypothetical protein P170DRAFT_24711 [Aspergillus steynii IBT 23096]
MKGLHGGIPIAVLAAVARAQVDVIGGSDGLDSGNAGGVSTDNDFSRATTEVNKDDHHVDVNTKTKVDVDVDAYPDPYWHHWHPYGPPHWRKARGHPGTTVIGGPNGIDTGNDASLPTKNEFASFYKEHNQDDHSVDVDNKLHYEYDVHGHPYPVPVWKRDPKFWNPPATLIDGPHGIDTGNDASLPTKNEFASFYKEHNQDDHSVDIDNKLHYEYDVHGHPYPVPVWKRDPKFWNPPATVIDGPGGIDTGNSASLPTKNEFASFYKEHNQDDHSVDIDNKLHYEYDVHGHPYPVPVWKRDPKFWNPPATVIDGPGGIDTGNSASLPTKNEFASFYKEHNQDDHSVDIDNKQHYDYDVHGHPYPVPVWKRDPKFWNPPATVIDGPGGVDSGNGFSAPTENSYTSVYDEFNKDDHSWDLDNKLDYDYHDHPYPVPVPAYHHWKARGLGDTVIDGPGGVDTGSSASVPTKNEFGVAYSETNIDDHSVDIDHKTDVDVDTHYPYPVPYPVPVPGYPHHWKARGLGDTVIDGPGGIDTGNDASIPTENEFASGHSETNVDDHSVDIDHKTDVDVDTHLPYPVPYPVPHPFHYHPDPYHLHVRGFGDTGIDGPGGVDSGNGFSAPTKNSYASVYDEFNKDDHSFTGKAAADIDIDEHHPYPVPVPVHHWKARGHPTRPWNDVTLIDGPGGIDTGNDADLSTTNTFLSDYDEFNQDDHSFTGKAAADVDIDHDYPYPFPVPAHFWKARSVHEPPVTVIGGPSGIDTGNSADLSSANTAITDYDEFNGDDHSVDAKAKADWNVHYRRSIFDGPTDVIDGPGGVDTGNGFSAPKSNHVATGYSEYNQNDHHVDIDTSTDVDVDAHAHPFPVPHPVGVPHPAPVPPRPVYPGPGPFHEPEAVPEPAPEHAPEHAPAPAPAPAPAGEGHVPQEAPHANPAPGPEPVVQHNPQGEETHQAPPSSEVHAPVPENKPQTPSPQTETSEPIVHSEPAPAPPAAAVPNTPNSHSQSDVSPPAAPNSNSQPAPAPPAAAVPNTPNTPNSNWQPAPAPPAVHSAGAPPAASPPSAPSVNQGNYQPAPPAAQSQAIPDSVEHAAQTSAVPIFHGMATPSSSAAHAALTSTVTVPQASSFAKIPVFVPQSSAATPPASHAPASSTVIVHPTGAAASTPSSASSNAAIASRADAVFTGGVGQLTPHAGVFSVVCGVIGLLAFVL